MRKISYGEGVERVFPLYAPMINSIKVVRRGKVRRAKLYYLRGRRGKSARIVERQDHTAPVARRRRRSEPLRCHPPRRRGTKSSPPSSLQTTTPPRILDSSAFAVDGVRLKLPPHSRFDASRAYSLSTAGPKSFPRAAACDVSQARCASHNLRILQLQIEIYVREDAWAPLAKLRRPRSKWFYLLLIPALLLATPSPPRKAGLSIPNLMFSIHPEWVAQPGTTGRGKFSRNRGPSSNAYKINTGRASRHCRYDLPRQAISSASSRQRWEITFGLYMRPANPMYGVLFAISTDFFTWNNRVHLTCSTTARMRTHQFAHAVIL